MGRLSPGGIFQPGMHFALVVQTSSCKIADRLLLFRRLGIFVLSIDAPVDSAV